MTCGLNLALHLVLYNPQAKNGFYILLNSRKNQKIFFDMWKLYEIHISVSIYKIVLEHRHAHSFILVYGGFYASMAELSSCDQDRVASKG